MLLKSSSIQHILEQVEALQPAKEDVLLLLFPEQSTPDIPALIDALNQKNIQFFGGIFPGLIYGNQRIREGCILKKFKALLPPFSVTNIAACEFTGFPNIDSMAHIDKGTAIVLVDGLTPNIYRFLEKLNDLLGEQCTFIGGGAGSISLQPEPCVFNKDGFRKDAAVVCVIDQRTRLGVRHGWEHLAGPLVATATDGNTILQLNWRKAIDVYNDIVETDCGIALTETNFAGIAQGYPFGILREKEDDIVRDPLAIGQDGSIVCIGEVPPNTVLHVLKGRPEALLNAARKAISECAEKPGFPIEAEGTFVVDCITRTLYLNEEFAEEMEIIRAGIVITSDQQEPFGVLSLGEISSYGEGLLELFNKTIAIGTFY